MRVDFDAFRVLRRQRALLDVAPARRRIMSLGCGWKARIGPLYPSGGLCDCETQSMAPEAGKLACPDSDGLRVSWAGIQIAFILEEIEAVMQRCAIASNQAVLWTCLKLLDVNQPARGFGRLLACEFDP
jgi:hypothetical protein